MLLVNAKAGPSRIHGTGLIAQEFIPSGTKIWEFRPDVDELIPEGDLHRLSPAQLEHTLYWCCFHLATRTFVVSGDDDRFTNHSDNPNTRVNGDGESTYAVRDIQPGEEITSDYKELVMVNFPEPNHYGVQWAQRQPSNR